MAVPDSKRRVALITGVTGQDGAYLAEYLLGLGYSVHGIKRRSSSFNTARIDHLYQDPHAGNVPFLLHYGDMTDSTNLIRLMQQVRPTEVYKLLGDPSKAHRQLGWRHATTFDQLVREMVEADLDGLPVRVVELTGRAGDVYVTHPWILHSIAPNASDTPRMMRSRFIWKSA